MLAGNLVTSPRFLGIEQEYTAYCAQRKQICSTSPSLTRYIPSSQ